MLWRSIIAAMTTYPTPPFSGRCLCGATRYDCDAAPIWQLHCHCESCRRATGSAFTQFFAIADGHWRWSAAEPGMFRSSPKAQRFHCATCASPMAYRSEAALGEMHFHAVTLDDPSAFAAEGHDFWDERLPWLQLSDGLPST